MSSVQIRILTGPAKGTRLRVDKDTARFGRAPESDIPIDQPFVSREHGQLRLTDAGWVLENHSPNGTTLSGKSVTKKPRPIAAGQVVSIGTEDVFEIISLDAPEAAPLVEEKPAEPIDTKKKLSGRSKLWIGIGAYVMLMMLAAVFLSTMDSGNNQQDPIERLGPLSQVAIRDQVVREIRRTLEKQPPDSRKVREFSEDALRAYHANDPGALYRTVLAYREALSYSPGLLLDDVEDQKRYIEAQEKLIDEISLRYYNAYNAMRNRESAVADNHFRQLSQIFNAPGTELFADIEKYRALNNAQIRRRR